MLVFMHDTDKYRYLGDFWLSQCATNKLHYFFNAACYITQSSTFFDYIHLRPRKVASNTLHY